MAVTERFHFPPEHEKRSLEALETALGTAPLYRSWRELDPGPDTPLDRRYAALPELTKKAMREHFPQGLVPNGLRVEDGLARGEIQYTFTSGTTEERVINLWNQRWWYASEAASWKLNAHTARLGYPQKEAKLASSLNIGIHCEEDLPMEYRTIGHTLFLNEKINVISWQPRHLERMVHELGVFQPVVLEANPSLLARVAWWALDHGVEVFSPAVIIFTYELPSEIHLAAIRQVFSSPLVSSYGSTETGFVLMQCENGLFHQNTEFCRIDFQPLAPEHGGPDLGRILVTTFGNPWTSIVRFDMGDLAGGRPRNHQDTVSYVARALSECDRPRPVVAYLGVANGDSLPFYWAMRSLLMEAGAGDVSMLRLAGKKADAASAKKALEEADAVYLSGGEVEDGMRWLEHHDLVGFLRDIRDQGKVFIGMSAGSIMMGTHWVRWEDPHDDATASLFDCLGFAPTIFDTHAEDEDWKELKAALRLRGPGVRGYGIPTGGLAIVDSEGRILAPDKPLLCFANVDGQVVEVS